MSVRDVIKFENFNNLRDKESDWVHDMAFTCQCGCANFLFCVDMTMKCVMCGEYYMTIETIQLAVETIMEKEGQYDE